MSWEDIPGQSLNGDVEAWYTSLADTMPRGARFVEVGVLFGRGIALMGTLRPDLDLWAVDSWAEENVGAHTAYRDKYGSQWFAFLGGMREHAPDVLQRLHVVRSLSTAATISNVDAAFVDADHGYEGVRADIQHYLPHVKAGGVLSGHDYHMDGVARAVDEAFGGKRVMGPSEKSTVWVVQR